jgi:hypothetical protein
MIVSTELAGLLGPFSDIQQRADRLVCDGAEVPFVVIGAYQLLDLDVPDGLRAEDCALQDGRLVRKLPVVPEEPAAPGGEG